MKKRFLMLFCVFVCVLLLPFESVAKGLISVKKSTTPQAQKITLPKIEKKPFNAPEIQVVETDIGVTAWLIEESSTPVIAMSVLFKGGSASDPKRLKGLSSLAMALMDEGAGKLKAPVFTELLAQKGIGMSFSASKEALFAELETLRDNKEEAFDLFHLALTKPRFDKKYIKQIKSQMVANIKAQEGNPNAIVAKRWAKLVYKNHPYADLTPTEKTLKAITKSNLKRLVSSRLAKDNLIIGVSGNISASELKPLLEKTFKDLPEHSIVKPIEPFTPTLQADVDILSMNIPQSAVVFGHQGLPRDDKDFDAARLVNYIFGEGSLSSRLFAEVREKKGLAYSVYTTLDTNLTSPMIMGAVGSDNAKLSEAIAIIRQEWQKMAEKGPTKQELQDAKTYMTGAFPLAFSSSSGLSSFLMSMQYYHLGLDYLQTQSQRMNAVTLKQARQTAKRLLKPENLYFVIVGKPANL